MRDCIGSTCIVAILGTTASASGQLLRSGSADGSPPFPSPFAVRVLEYTPADGQFVNDPQFNDPVRALGAPIGGGTLFAGNSKVVTLGGFGGSITLGFARHVQDDPRNPFGIDCIIFGNAFWPGGDPLRRFAEAAVIEIAADVNNNGLADDPWYLIPGSHIHDAGSQQRDGRYILPEIPFAAPPLINSDPNEEEVFGYADATPVLRLGDLDGDNLIDDATITPERFYTVPDDPYEVGITPGSGGGDGFDIAWAIDPATGEPAHLRGFDFIRITTAVDADSGELGEVSAEIGGVAIVGPAVTPIFAPLSLPGAPGPWMICGAQR